MPNIVHNFLPECTRNLMWQRIALWMGEFLSSGIIHGIFNHGEPLGSYPHNSHPYLVALHSLWMANIWKFVSHISLKGSFQFDHYVELEQSHASLWLCCRLGAPHLIHNIIEQQRFCCCNCIAYSDQTDCLAVTFSTRDVHIQLWAKSRFYAISSSNWQMEGYMMVVCIFPLSLLDRYLTWRTIFRSRGGKRCSTAWM